MLSRAPRLPALPAFSRLFHLFPLLGLLAGCAPPPQSPDTWSTADLDEAIRRSSAAPSAAPLVLAGPLREPHELAHAPAPRPRKSGRRVDVELNNASLDAALQLLASEAGVGLVLPDALSATVSVSLRRVDPLDALFALAEAQGLQVERPDRRLLVVRRR